MKNISETQFNIMKILDFYDKKVSDKIHSLELNEVKERIVYLFARLFNPDFIIFYFLSILIYKLLFFNDFLFVLKPLTHVLVCLIFTLVIKKLTGRPRPTPKEKTKRRFDLRQHEKNCSMPSGDSLQCANFSIILLLYFNSYAGFLLLPFVMFSRVFYFCHYILDTIVGASLGIVLSYLVFNKIN